MRRSEARSGGGSCVALQLLGIVPHRVLLREEVLDRPDLGVELIDLSDEIVALGLFLRLGLLQVGEIPGIDRFLERTRRRRFFGLREKRLMESGVTKQGWSGNGPLGFMLAGFLRRRGSR